MVLKQEIFSSACRLDLEEKTLFNLYKVCTLQLGTINIFLFFEFLFTFFGLRGVQDLKS